jgi:glycosyltransferase involved in cell wall biosynthesis
LRVLYFTRDFSPHDERFLSALGQTGHEVYFLRLEPGKVVLPPQGTFEIHFSTEALNSAPTSLDRAVALKQILNTLAPDILHAGPLHGPAYTAALTGFPRLVSMSWGADILHDGEVSEDTHAKIQYSLDHSAVLACDCLAVADKAEGEYRFPSNRIFRFPWGVDLEHFTPRGGAALREHQGWQDQFVFLSNRSFEPIYGVDVTLQAFITAAQIEPNIRLLLFGRGSQEQQLSEMVEDAGIADRVHFGGYVDRAGLPDSYRSSDIFLTASHCDGSSVSLMEALACGVPAIVSDIPGNLEWVRDGDQGWVFRDGNVEQMAGLMVAARRESALADYRVRARTLAEKNADWRRNFPVLLDAYAGAFSIHGSKSESRAGGK